MSACARLYRKGRLEADDLDLTSVSEHLEQPDAVVWIDLVDPTREQLETLAVELDLHELAVEDALKARQRPKLDVYDSHTFVAVRALRLDLESGTLAETELHAFTDTRWMVTVRSDDLHDLSGVARRISSSPRLVEHGASYLLYAVLDAVVDDYVEIAQLFDDYYDEISEGLFEERPIAEGRQRQWFEVRRSLVRFHRVSTAMREVVSSLRRRDRRFVPDALDPYYQDVYDHLVRVIESADATRELGATIVETNISLRDYRQNQVMKRVTSWAAIVAVPTLVTGFYGMNVPYPGFDRGWGVWVSVVLMVALSGFLYAQFKSRDWL